MTTEQRTLLENVADWNRLSRVEGHEAVAAALAEIDRLRDEVAATKEDWADDRDTWIEQQGVSLAEINRLKAQPPRPAAIVIGRTYGEPAKWDAFEDEGEAERFWHETKGEMGRVLRWTWHPRKEGARGAADDR